MKNKTIVMLAAIICMAAFLFPMAAYAASDSTPPTVNAWLNGDTLHIEASDDFGVESIYVDNHRFNYLVNGSIDINARDNHDNKEKISVYAVDFAGNKSAVVQLANPYYKASGQMPTPVPASTPTPKPSAITPATSTTPTPTPTPTPSTTTSTQSTEPVATSDPQSVPDQSESVIPADPQPFTPDGTGTVMDDITQQNGKEFFTITTASDNVFYLIIDRDRSEKGVYLLNAVTESDLKALAEKDKNGGNSQSAVPTSPTDVKPTTTPETQPTPAPAEKPTQNSNGTIIFIIIAAVIAGGAGYYFKIYKPKQQEPADDDDSDYDDPDDYDSDADPDDLDYEFEEDAANEDDPDKE